MTRRTTAREIGRWTEGGPERVRDRGRDIKTVRERRKERQRGREGHLVRQKET